MSSGYRPVRDMFHADRDSDAWYTNPQTEAFCGMLGIENKINPTPST